MAERRWSLPQNPLEIQENGVVIDSDVGVIDFIDLAVTQVTVGKVEVSDALFGGSNAALTQLKCVRLANCEYYQEVVFLTDKNADLLRRAIC